MLLVHNLFVESNVIDTNLTLKQECICKPGTFLYARSSCCIIPSSEEIEQVPDLEKP